MVEAVFDGAFLALHLDRPVRVTLVQEAALWTCSMLARLLPCELVVSLEERTLALLRVQALHVERRERHLALVTDRTRHLAHCPTAIDVGLDVCGCTALAEAVLVASLEAESFRYTKVLEAYRTAINMMHQHSICFKGRAEAPLAETTLELENGKHLYIGSLER